MQLAAARHRYEHLHKDKPWHDGTRTFWSDKPTQIHRFHYSDGVRIFLTLVDLGLGGDFLEQGQATDSVFGQADQASGIVSQSLVPEQAPGDEHKAGHSAAEYRPPERDLDDAHRSATVHLGQSDSD